MADAFIDFLLRHLTFLAEAHKHHPHGIHESCFLPFGVRCQRATQRQRVVQQLALADEARISRLWLQHEVHAAVNYLGARCVVAVKERRVVKAV